MKNIRRQPSHVIEAEEKHKQQIEIRKREARKKDIGQTGKRKSRIVPLSNGHVINVQCRSRNFNSRLLLEVEFMEKHLNMTTMKKLIKTKPMVLLLLLLPLVRQFQKKIIGCRTKRLHRRKMDKDRCLDS